MNRFIFNNLCTLIVFLYLIFTIFHSTKRYKLNRDKFESGDYFLFGLTILSSIFGILIIIYYFYLNFAQR